MELLALGVVALQLCGRFRTFGHSAAREYRKCADIGREGAAAETFKFYLKVE
jgi:hypothetical protein